MSTSSPTFHVDVNLFAAKRYHIKWSIHKAPDDRLFGILLATDNIVGTMISYGGLGLQLR